MNSATPERYYRLLYFSPRPEDEEKVCVGLLIGDGKATYLDYDDRLDKVHSFAPDYSKDSIAFVLETIQAESRRFTAQTKLQELSPQFTLSPPRKLLQPLDDRVRTLLRQKYLLRPKPLEHKRKEKGVERKIDRFLTEHMRLPLSLIKRKATVDELVGAEASSRLPKDLIPKPVTRAVVVDTGILLVDGVDLHLHSADLLVNRINRVAHTFWQYSQLKELVPAFKKTGLFRAAVIFDGTGPEVEPSLKWRADYARHQFEKDADATVKAGAVKQELYMREELHKLLPEGLVGRQD